MKNEQQDLLNEAYENYCISYKDGHEFYEDEEVKRSFTQEEFINKCKTDTEFSERWGLKIEERELSLKERRKLAKYSAVFISPMTVESWDRDNIPTKLITITYNNEKIESYDKGTNGCMYNCGDSCTGECIEPKQGTIEGAAEEFAKNHSIYPTAQDDTEYGFKHGAKWAQEEIKQFLYAEICERRPYTSSRMCEEVIKFIEQMDKQQ
jgi:hypothetical protein